MRFSSVHKDDLRELLEDAWRRIAPQSLIDSFDTRERGCFSGYFAFPAGIGFGGAGAAFPAAGAGFSASGTRSMNGAGGDL